MPLYSTHTRVCYRLDPELDENYPGIDFRVYNPPWPGLSALGGLSPDGMTLYTVTSGPSIDAKCRGVIATVNLSEPSGPSSSATSKFGVRYIWDSNHDSSAPDYNQYCHCDFDKSDCSSVTDFKTAIASADGRAVIAVGQTNGMLQNSGGDLPGDVPAWGLNEYGTIAFIAVFNASKTVTADYDGFNWPALRWKIYLPRYRLVSPPAVTPNGLWPGKAVHTVVSDPTGNSNAILMCIAVGSANGTSLWDFTLPATGSGAGAGEQAQIVEQPTIALSAASDVLFAATWNATYALDATTGKLVWSAHLNRTLPRTLTVVSQPDARSVQAGKRGGAELAATDIVLVASLRLANGTDALTATGVCSPTVHALSAGTGRVLWERPLSGLYSCYELDLLMKLEYDPDRSADGIPFQPLQCYTHTQDQVFRCPSTELHLLMSSDNRTLFIALEQQINATDVATGATLLWSYNSSKLTTPCWDDEPACAPRTISSLTQSVDGAMLIVQTCGRDLPFSDDPLSRPLPLTCAIKLQGISGEDTAKAMFALDARSGAVIWGLSIGDQGVRVGGDIPQHAYASSNGMIMAGTAVLMPMFNTGSPASIDAAFIAVVDMGSSVCPSYNGSLHASFPTDVWVSEAPHSCSLPTKVCTHVNNLAVPWVLCVLRKLLALRC